MAKSCVRSAKPSGRGSPWRLSLNRCRHLRLTRHPKPRQTDFQQRGRMAGVGVILALASGKAGVILDRNPRGSVTFHLAEVAASGPGPGRAAPPDSW